MNYRQKKKELKKQISLIKDPIEKYVLEDAIILMRLTKRTKRHYSGYATTFIARSKDRKKGYVVSLNKDGTFKDASVKLLNRE